MMFSLKNEDLTGLGGPMGTERVTTRWVKYFNSLQTAKNFAEKDYKLPIQWVRDRQGRIHSGDLGWVMYTIREIQTED